MGHAQCSIQVGRCQEFLGVIPLIGHKSVQCSGEIVDVLLQVPYLLAQVQSSLHLCLFACLFVCYEVSPGVGCCGGQLAGLPRCMSRGYESAELLNLHNEQSTDVLCTLEK